MGRFCCSSLTASPFHGGISIFLDSKISASLHFSEVSSSSSSSIRIVAVATAGATVAVAVAVAVAIVVALAKVSVETVTASNSTSSSSSNSSNNSGTVMSGAKIALDLVHKASVMSLLAGTAYGTYFVSCAMVELRRAGQAAAKQEEDK